MSEPHPTIPGVTVEIETRQYPFVPIGEQSRPYDVRVLRFPLFQNPPIRVESWTWPTSYKPGPLIVIDELFYPEHTEIVIAMIRDQQQWLEQQGDAS